jgi:hypothetical protein
MESSNCQVQVTSGKILKFCDRPAVAAWDWGGPTLAMCQSHDDLMRRHVGRSTRPERHEDRGSGLQPGCKACRDRLIRTIK